jgi:hypothetical protein
MVYECSFFECLPCSGFGFKISHLDFIARGARATQILTPLEPLKESVVHGFLKQGGRTNVFVRHCSSLFQSACQIVAGLCSVALG